MSNNLSCEHLDHKDQRLSFPVDAIIETVSPVAHLGTAIPAGARGRITSHCDDGRAWILFDDYDDAGHTFHTPERFIRVVELPGSDCVTECASDHPWHDCPKCGIGICGDHVVAFLNHSSHEPPAPRAGERDKWRAFKHYVLNAAGLLVAEAQAEERAAQIVTEHNQHAILIEQRERLLSFVRPFAEKGCVCMGETCAQRRLKKFCTPCRAAELIATIEREGVQ